MTSTFALSVAVASSKKMCVLSIRFDDKKAFALTTLLDCGPIVTLTSNS